MSSRERVVGQFPCVEALIVSQRTPREGSDETHLSQPASVAMQGSCLLHTEGRVARRPAAFVKK
jgi:hypothetical protein